MNQQMMPFGVGTRVCGGQNLAQVMLRIVVAGVARNFIVSAQASETNDRTMQILLVRLVRLGSVRLNKVNITYKRNNKSCNDMSVSYFLHHVFTGYLVSSILCY